MNISKGQTVQIEVSRVLMQVVAANALCMSSCGLNRRSLTNSGKDEYTRNFI